VALDVERRDASDGTELRADHCRAFRELPATTPHLRKSPWKLTMHDGVPHLIPPRWIDTEQTPIPTTRRRTIKRPAA
jgi:hypothetical protein